MKENKDSKCKCPLIELEYQNQKIKAVIDTGSEVDCISEELYEKLDKVKISTLPVSNIRLFSAFGSKSYNIKKQIMIKLKFDKQEIDSVLLVVPKLNFDFILGTNWCAKNNVDVKFSNNTITLNNQVFQEPVVTFKDNTIQIIEAHLKPNAQIGLINEKVKINTGNDGDCVNNLENNEGKQLINTEINKIRNKIAENSSISNKKYENVNTDFDTILKESIKNTYKLSEDMKKELVQLIRRYKKIFSDEPGCIRSYEHEIRLKNKKIITRKNYPVPLAKREKVRNEIVRLEKMGIIEKAISEYCNPLRIVDKKRWGHTHMFRCKIFK